MGEKQINKYGNLNKKYLYIIILVLFINLEKSKNKNKFGHILDNNNV